MSELTINELIGKSPKIDNKYNQELWEATCIDCKLYEDMEQQPYKFEIEDCIKLQLILFLEYGIFSTTTQVYEIWGRWSAWMSASWLLVEYDSAVNIFKNFMDNSKDADFLN